MIKKQINWQVATGYIPQDLAALRSEIATLQANDWEVFTSEVAGIHRGDAQVNQPLMVVTMVKYAWVDEDANVKAPVAKKVGRPKKEQPVPEPA